MMYKYITQSSRKIFFKTITYILIFAFALNSGGCYSLYESDVETEKIMDEGNVEIIKAIMKDGLVVNLRDKTARYSSNYDNHRNVIIYSSPGAVKASILELKDISYLTIEKEDMNTGATILATLGVIAGLVLIIGLIALAAKESCPFIYSFDGEKYIFDGEPYGGAIAEGLIKTDYSRLENLKPVDGKYKLLMRNEADETQHTDEMKLLVIEHPLNTEVAPDVRGKMTVFEKAFSPLSVTDENGKDISVFFDKKDNVQWQTNMPDDSMYDSKKLKHELILKFAKPKDAKKVKLLVNAGTALWGGYMIKEMLELRGNKVDNWYENINNKGPELKKLYQFMEREELYILKVNVLENENWVTEGSISACGPFLDEDRVVELNTENIKGDTLCIKLNPPAGYWKFDYAGVIYESVVTSKITELSASYAKNEKGEDLLDSLYKTDGRYYSMYDTTSTAKLEFDVPVQIENMNRSLYLRTTGYYDIHLKKDKPEQAELIQKIYNDPGLIIEITMKEYIKKIRSLGMLNN